MSYIGERGVEEQDAEERDSQKLHDQEQDTQGQNIQGRDTQGQDAPDQDTQERDDQEQDQERSAEKGRDSQELRAQERDDQAKQPACQDCEFRDARKRLTREMDVRELSDLEQQARAWCGSVQDAEVGRQAFRDSQERQTQSQAEGVRLPQGLHGHVFGPEDRQQTHEQRDAQDEKWRSQVSQQWFPGEPRAQLGYVQNWQVASRVKAAKQQCFEYLQLYDPEKELDALKLESDAPQRDQDAQLRKPDAQLREPDAQQREKDALNRELDHLNYEQAAQNRELGTPKSVAGRLRPGHGSAGRRKTAMLQS
ncbi:UPF0746 protein DDB_G0281095-like [Sycon ciliatum]|uniref:UPF0746 protein DDB_G0281095-like n=1 Tax=Sycon ciliatum TaxID=27933 RepID=UPI0031F71261